jgi:branched-chain amino acid transport system ATP-binding protein
MLDVKNLTKEFGELTVLKNCSIHVEQYTVRGLIGPNGAGKTTLINTISGFYKPDKGEIYFKTKRIDGMRPHEVAREGIGRTFQISRPFSGMTLLDNLITAGFSRYKDLEENKNKAKEILEFFELYRLKDEMAANISGGQKKLLEIARALVSGADLILLDEPFHGVHPDFKKQITEHVKSLTNEGKTFILVSHDVPSVVNTCDRISVLCAGEVIAEGSGQEIRGNPRVVEAYLGT